MRRSRAFSDLDIPDIPTGNLAEITTKLVPGAARQAQDVLDGKLDYMQEDPPAALEPTIVEQASDRFSENATAATVYFELDDERPPFDDPLVREAVNRGRGPGRGSPTSTARCCPGARCSPPASRATTSASTRPSAPTATRPRRPTAAAPRR